MGGRGGGEALLILTSMNNDYMVGCMDTYVQCTCTVQS